MVVSQPCEIRPPLVDGGQGIGDELKDADMVVVINVVWCVVGGDMAFKGTVIQEEVMWAYGVSVEAYGCPCVEREGRYDTFVVEEKVVTKEA